MNEIIFWGLIVCVPFIAIGMGYGFVVFDEKKEKRKSFEKMFREQNKHYKQALEFYADRDNYKLEHFDPNIDGYMSTVDYDEGNTARKALEEIEVKDNVVEYHSVNGRVYKVTKGKEKWERII